MKIGEVAKRLEVTTDVIRYAANTYSEHVTDSAGGHIKGAKRQFTEHDCQVLATILKLREQGLAPDQISQALKTTDLEPCPEMPDPAATAARESIALVAQPEYERALDRIVQLQTDLEQAKEEREQALETWQTDVTKLNDRIADLERELGHAQGELDILRADRRPSDYWLTRLAVAVLLTVAAVVIIGGVILWVATRT